MSYTDRLRTEINEALDALAEQGSPWVANWIANEICKNHEDGLGEGEHADFWRHCGYCDCRNEVRLCINRRAGDRPESEKHQFTLPGWEHLQAYYLVSRDGVEVGVPVHEMSEQEVKAKAALYRSMAAACYAHADELDKYLVQREEAA